MERTQIPHLLDKRGQPFTLRIERLLRGCIPQLREQFAALRNDELLLTLVLEEGGRRLVRWEQQQRRPLDEWCHQFAWKVVLNVGRSWMVLDANRMNRATIRAEAGEAILSRLPSTSWGTPQQIEDAVRLRETHDRLPEDQWSVLESKIAGYSAAQIGEKRGSSADAVNMVFSRAKRKLRALLGPLPAAAADGTRGGASRGAPQPSAHNRGDTHADGQLAPAPRLVCVHRRE
jgi:DNA-directed RNA polymerase specialized sigma24 family protein